VHFAEIFQENVVITSDHERPQEWGNGYFTPLRLKLSTKII